MLAKEDSIDNIVQQFNAFDDNLQFTIDKFTDNNVHFLDIKIDRNEIDLFYKTTHTQGNILILQARVHGN